MATAVEAVIPDAVSVTRAELAGSLRERLLALAVGTGLQVMDAIIDESVTVLAGPKSRLARTEDLDEPRRLRSRTTCNGARHGPFVDS